MELNELLKIKLKEDLVKELSEFNVDLDIVNDLIDHKICEVVITIDKEVTHLDNKDEEDDNKCCSRIMGDRYSDRRCPYHSQKDSDYCKNHIKRMNEYGYLAFGRYDEKRPSINEKCNKIPWRDMTAMEDINTVIQYQNMKLLKMIK